MWDLIVSVPDHCLSFYLANYFANGLVFFSSVQSTSLSLSLFCFVDFVCLFLSGKCDALVLHLTRENF